MTGLGLPTGGDGNFVPYLKYNAKAGRWYTKDDEGAEFEVSQITAVFDFTGIKTGLMMFATGQAPDYVFDSAVGANDAVQPAGGLHKRGFQLLVFAEKSFNGVRELSSTAGVVNKVMNELYGAYDVAPEKAQGQLPVVTCNGVTPVESKHGTNYAPNLAIVGWTVRPAAFDEAPADTALAPQPSSGVPAPTPQAVPAGVATEF
ncbi:MAG: hypothetical protein GY862_28185 [Gammaproteobacteria bacterium]|nr:hypothetical protein [Gammaproteobacteria bacterium]